MIKLISVGDGGSGKTSLMLAYAENKFPFDYLPTFLDDCVVTVSPAGIPTEFAMWDTNSSSSYDRMRCLSYHNTNVFLITFSITFPPSLQNVETRWYPELRRYSPDVCVFLVATKIDLRSDEKTLEKLMSKNWAPVTSEQGETMAKKLGIRYFETSALTGQGVRNLFEAAIAQQPRNLEKREKKCRVS